jgi:chromosome segregation ATPase
MSTVESDLHIEDEHETDGAVAPLVRRAPRISQSDVFRAADELLLDGRRPTIDRVRMRLGRGSPNTINDHLDAWWAKLGARLRDLPGREFPQLPERIAYTLQQLWNEALEGAREALQATLLEREQSLAQHEAALQERAQQLTEREQAAAVRGSALEESLSLAREQLSATNQRAAGLEKSLQERDGECARIRTQLERLDASATEARAQFDAAAAAHHGERAQLQERYARAESHWLLEVDRARQQAKEAAKDHERDMKELRRRVEALQGEREQLRQDLLEVRAECKMAVAVREQLEERLRAASHAATERATRAQGTRNRIATQGSRRSRRSPRSTTHPAK